MFEYGNDRWNVDPHPGLVRYISANVNQSTQIQTDAEKLMCRNSLQFLLGDVKAPGEKKKQIFHHGDHILVELVVESIMVGMVIS